MNIGTLMQEVYDVEGLETVAELRRILQVALKAAP